MKFRLTFTVLVRA